MTDDRRQTAEQNGGWFLPSALCLLSSVLFRLATGSDWPTHMHDNQRSGVTSEQLSLPLREAWTHAPRHAPRPAWPAPAKIDYWHKLTDLAARVTYDRTFHVAAVGDAVYFASSADDKVTCLDAATGQVRWVFFTGGPVRLAPTVADGKVYVGSDDGQVYLLDAKGGAEVQRGFRDQRGRQLIGNGRLIAASPVRTGVLVDGGTAYYTAGLFPTEGVALCALDAVSRHDKWAPKPLSLSPQGYLVASDTHLYIPTGRSAPAIVRRADGAQAGTCKGTGGTDLSLCGSLLLSGPGKTGQVDALDAATGEVLATFNAHRAIGADKALYLLTGREIQALDRSRYFDLLAQSRRLAARQKAIAEALKKLGKDTEEAKKLRGEQDANKAALASLAKEMSASYLWKRPCPHRAAVVLAGDALFVGGESEVAAFRASDGEPLWAGKVAGTAYGLAVAHGRLFVSTDAGVIHCFGHVGGESLPRVPPDPPYPTDHLTPPYERAAKEIAAKAGAGKGFCVVLACGDGRLVYELAKLTSLTIVGIEDDAGKRSAARRALDAAGLYGPRATVQSGPLASLPSGFANLVVLDRVTNPNAAAPDAARLVRPFGGALCLDGAASLTRRGPPEGAGEWTHVYADPANTACSGDRLVGGEMRIQWFGPPGPNPMADRHHRAVPPLAGGGRLFVPAYNKVIALDAFNGTHLWEAEMPASSRLGAPKDSGYLALAPDVLYAAGPDDCVAFDAATGAVVRRFPVPPLEPGGQRAWGYVATVGDSLFGSGRKKGASLRTMGRAVIEIQFGDFQDIATSDLLFCLDRKTGEKRWAYQGGAILDPTIAIADGRVFLVESANPAALQDADGRMKLDFLLGQGASLVALDAASGQTLWKKPVDLRSFQHIIFLSVAEGTIVVTGSKNKDGSVWYELLGFDAKTGEPRWRREQDNRKKPGGDHGEQTLHPVVAGGVVYAEPCAYDLKTGEPVPGWKFDRGGGGCGTMSASANQLFFRAANPAMFDLRSRKASKLSTVSRPGCWINIIPAGGLVLVPEASSGCTCPFPIQTSFAFAPLSDARHEQRQGD